MIIRSAKKKWTTVDNEWVKDPNLTLKAKGLLIYMLSLPDDWGFHMNELANHFDNGIDSIKSTMKELKDKGYVECKHLRDEKGRYMRWDYWIHERPKVNNPKVDNPKVDNPPLLSTNKITNTNNTNSSCRFSSDGGVYKITKYFFKELININNAVKNKYKDYSPKQIESLLQRWCDNIDKLIRIDNAEPDEIYKVLEWLFKDDFWSTVIQSTDNLRKTYSKLYAKLKGNKPNLQQDITKYNIQIKEILDYFKEKTGREFTTDSPGIDNMIILLKKGNLVRAFKWVIDAKCEDWLNNPKMDKYLTLNTLFGDNFENYIKEKEFSEVEKGGDEKNDN